jgi:hypothetical protein
LDGNVEIIFSTNSCVSRFVFGFIIVLISGIVLLGGRVALYILADKRWSTDAPPGTSDPLKMDRIAIYSIIGLVVAFLVVFSLSMALSKTNTSLVASGNRIEVRGCVKGRPFVSNFDRDVMSATHRIVRNKRSTYHDLVLRQKGQRTVEISLGNQATDSKLVLIAPEAMKLYAQWLRDAGKSVPLALQ